MFGMFSRLVTEYSKDLKIQLLITIGTVPLGASSGNLFEEQEQHNQGILQRGGQQCMENCYCLFSLFLYFFPIMNNC